MNSGVTNISLEKVHSLSWALPVTQSAPKMPVGKKRASMFPMTPGPDL